MWIVASIGRRRVRGPAATLRPIARRIETAALGIRHRHMRTRALMERAVWTVWTGAARAGARPFDDSQVVRPGRGASRAAGSGA